MSTTATATTTTTTTITPINDPSHIPRGPVVASLSFFKPPSDGSAPFNYVEAPPPGEPQRNYGDVNQDVLISDIRGRESSFNLDTHAFAALSNIPSALPGPGSAFDDDATVQKVYYPEIEQLLLSQLPGARRVVIFDHTVRRAQPNAKRAPVQRTHIDQTTSAAIERVQRHLPDEADELLKGRVRLINVWRPLNAGPVQSFPLAFADSTTVTDNDLVGIQHRYPDRTGETAAIRYGGRDPSSGEERQKWYYWSGMDGEKAGERLLLQCFDNVSGARVPHSAFVHARTPEGAEARESVEVRTLVFG